jgi:hypothetical protein
MDLKKVCATAALAVVVGFGLSGQARAGGFTNHSLSGPYTFRAQAFTVDEGGDEGGINFAGLLTFNGVGGISAVDIQVTGGDDSDTDQFDCGAITSIESGTYTVNSDGTGSLNVEFNPADACLPHDDIAFTFALSRTTGGIGQINSSTFSDSNSFFDCFIGNAAELFLPQADGGECLVTFVADGELQHQ